ncbi:MAG: DJ-1/PfpI family protein [Clostridia bacterium]|nr:DJ-1/PfpI family protein [Clostridia bacterium]
MIYVFLADGFEEIEALATVDVLRRAKLSVQTVGVNKTSVKGSHNMIIEADILDKDIQEDFEAIVLPGGMPGTINLEQSPIVQQTIDLAMEKKKVIAAICAAPSILGHKNLLNGLEAICFPGFEKDLYGARISQNAVTKSGNIITGKGSGVTIPFALKIVETLTSKDIADNVCSSMQCL